MNAITTATRRNRRIAGAEREVIREHEPADHRRAARSAPAISNVLIAYVRYSGS